MGGWAVDDSCPRGMLERLELRMGRAGGESSRLGESGAELHRVGFVRQVTASRGRLAAATEGRLARGLLPRDEKLAQDMKIPAQDA